MFAIKHSFWIDLFLRPDFTNSLRQPKPSFGVKIVLSGFTKDVQWRISAEKAWTQLFAPDLIENAFEFPLQMQNLWEESIKMNKRNAIY